MLTYGDAVGDINIAELVEFHKSHGRIGTMSMYNFGQNKGVVEFCKKSYSGGLATAISTAFINFGGCV